MDKSEPIMQAAKQFTEALEKMGYKQVCVLMGFVDDDGIPHTLKEQTTKDHNLAYHLVVAQKMLAEGLEDIL